MSLTNLLRPTETELANNMLDITEPAGPVEVSWSDDASVMWINIRGVCVCRVNGMKADQLHVQKPKMPKPTPIRVEGFGQFK
jgi:hypothetical protein